VLTDQIGHHYSRESEFYIQKIAAVKSNLEFLMHYL